MKSFQLPRSTRFFAFVSLNLAAAVDAYARAGGGGHFSGGGGGHSFGGGHSGGGGFGGHSSGGGGAFSSIGLIIFAIILAIAIINALIEMHRQQTVTRGNSALDRSKANALAELVRKTDPAFDVARFYGRMSSAFITIQSAWSAQDLRPMQPFVSDGVAERFGLQFREQQDLGYRNQMEQVRVTRVTLAKVTAGDVFQAATVQIDASAIDFDAALAGGKFLRGSHIPLPFTEYWTFIRRRGTTSTAGEGLIEGRCPNCGADIRMSQHVTCEHCTALLRSGRFDWVLCEITQASEWRPQNDRVAAGLEALRETDPGLSIEDLEDRAAVIFWRRAEADRTGKPAVLRKVATDAFVDASRASGAGEEASRNWLGEIGVGSIDVVELASGDGANRASICVAYSGTRFSQKNENAARRGSETSVIRETFTLVRQQGVTTDPDKGITSAHCPGCGAPVSSGLGNGCESCGRVLNDGSAGWVLESVQSGWNRTIAPVQTATPTPSPRGLVSWIVQMAAADGEIDAQERARIDQFARRSAMSGVAVEKLIAAARAGRLDTPEPEDRDELVEWLTAMIGMALVDGRIAKNEAALIRAAAGRAGFGEADVRLLIKKEQARQYAEAKEAIRDSRTR